MLREQCEKLHFLRRLRGMGGAFLTLFLCGCITFETTSTGDFDSEERYKKVIAEILKESEKSENKILGDQKLITDKELSNFVQRHFDKADEIVLRHAINARKSIPHITFNDYLDKRKALLDFTLKLNPTLVVVDSEFAFATAFPSGRVMISRTLARAFSAAEGEYDSGLLGILIHELIHVRDGHAIEQWATAEGRNAWVSDKVLGALANLTTLIPFLTVKYDIEYAQAFKSAKQLPELSEYAADLGAVSLLEKNGFEKVRYIAFLNEINARLKASKEAAKEPFSWMQGRVDCLKLFSATQFKKGVSEIIIGSYDDGDKVFLNLDYSGIYKTIEELDNPSELRKRYRSLASLTDAQLRENVLGRLQKDMFTACAIQNTFSAIPVVDGVLVTPGFDLHIFILHY